MCVPVLLSLCNLHTRALCCILCGGKQERSEAAILKILDHFAHIPGVRKYLDRTAYKVPNPRKASLHLGRSLTLLTLSPGTLVYYQRESECAPSTAVPPDCVTRTHSCGAKLFDGTMGCAVADTDAMYVILSGRAEILHSTHHMHRLLAQKELKYTKGAKHASRCRSTPMLHTHTAGTTHTRGPPVAAPRS